MFKSRLLCHLVFLSSAVAFSQQSSGSVAVSPVPSCCIQTIPADKKHFGQLLADRKFDELESIATQARSTKARYPGGSWKIRVFYSGLEDPLIGRAATEAEWAAHFANLQQWISAKPDSITARIALAHAYLSYAWKARGGGYADKVSEDGWKLFAERTGSAQSSLQSAAKLHDKDPDWFYAMLRVAQASGWEREAEDAILERAIQFEPLYYYQYRAHAQYLLPKWYGEKGETESFAAEIADRIGGKQGDAIYFEIAMAVYCNCKGEVRPSMDWSRQQRGYFAAEELYGFAMDKLNNYAYLANNNVELGAASLALERIGEDWDPGTWSTRENFERVRDVARDYAAKYMKDAPTDPAASH